MPLFTEKTDIYSIGCILLYLFFGCEFHFLQIQYLLLFILVIQLLLL